MSADDLLALLEQVRTGLVPIDEALHRLQSLTNREHSLPEVADIGFAHVDLQRRQRCGFPEVIFCEGKTPAWVEGVVRKLIEANQDCLATRVNAEQAEHLSRVFPQADQNRLARTFWLPAPGSTEKARIGRVVVVTAGTSDLPVAEEA